MTAVLCTCRHERGEHRVERVAEIITRGSCRHCRCPEYCRAGVGAPPPRPTPARLPDPARTSA